MVVSWVRRYVEIACRAALVGMLVYMDAASHVKRSAPQGRESCSMLFLRVKESLKYDGCFWATGWSIWSTHFPRPCGRLLMLEQTRQVGHLLFDIPLWILYVT